MRARKCDRCGHFYDHYQGDEMFKETGGANALRLIDRYEDNTFFGMDIYDLCPECMQKLERFLKNGYPGES